MLLQLCTMQDVNKEAYTKRLFDTTPLELKKDSMDIYIHKDKALEMKEFSTVNASNMVLVGRNEVMDPTDMIRVPDEMKEGFNIRISGSDKNNPIKVYSYANDKTELSSNFKRPEYFITNDFNIYNGKFVKVTNDKYTFYVNLNEVKWETFTDQNFKLIGNEKKSFINPVKNFTLEVCERTNFTVDDIYKITSGTSLEGLEDAVVKAEEVYGINALFILSVAALESGWGNSDLAMYRNNLFGIAAFDSNVDAAFDFATKEECVLYFAELISEDYVGEGRTDLYSINDKYATSDTWADKVGSMMNSMIAEI